MSQRAKANLDDIEEEHVDLPPSLLNTRRRMLREQYSEIRDELFPESWSIDVDNWTRKRYCPICKSSLSSEHNCFKNHSEELHDDWANLIQPWVKWKGLRNRKQPE
ncbi:MAG: hypothetical protein HYY22_02895 [Thaumarchaeota archaeon]|nr:hypothetical protein [Nitrososphaerota archaeon]